jgi:FkbM family methyltransferase
MPEIAKRLTDTDRDRLRLLRKLGLPVTRFFDVGASIGRWSSRVSQDFPLASFDLFEPLIDHAPDYRRKMEMTLARHPNFRLHKVALGSECKRTTMFIYPENLVGSTALPLSATPVGAQSAEVEMLTIDRVVEKLHLPPPQVIKMDTQGCELAILQGARATLPHVQALLLECWLARAYGPPTPLLFEVTEWLREFDFHLWDLGNGWRDSDGTLVAQDCFFLNARSPISRLKAEPKWSERKPPALPPKNERWWRGKRNPNEPVLA